MLDDELKALHDREFVKGQESVAKEAAVSRFEDQQALNQRLLKVANETIDVADKIAADGNPHKKQLADLIKDVVVGGVLEVAAGRSVTVEGGEPKEANPFSLASPSSGPKSLASPQSQKESPNGTTELSQPPKRKRGRPPKNPKT